MRAAPETVMRRAQLEFSTLSPDSAKALTKWKTDTIRDVATKFLQNEGVVLVGHQSVIDYAIDHASVEVAVAWDGLTAHAKRKRGRPAVDFPTLSLYAAAHWIFMTDGVSVAAAAKEAARFLGPPATKDRVEKGTKRWLRSTSILLTAGGGSDRVRKFLLQMLVDTAEDLARISDEIAAEKKAEETRRKSARHVSFIGATPRASLLPLTKETKQ